MDSFGYKGPNTNSSSIATRVIKYIQSVKQEIKTINLVLIEGSFATDGAYTRHRFSVWSRLYRKGLMSLSPMCRRNDRNFVKQRNLFEGIS